MRVWASTQLDLQLRHYSLVVASGSGVSGGMRPPSRAPSWYPAFKGGPPEGHNEYQGCRADRGPAIDKQCRVEGREPHTRGIGSIVSKVDFITTSTFTLEQAVVVLNQAWLGGSPVIRKVPELSLSGRESGYGDVAVPVKVAV